MANIEEEMKSIKEKNKELVKTVQHWKMTAMQRENEKLTLMREINSLKLKLCRHRNYSDIQASKLDSSLQAASEKALAELVQASSHVANIMNLTKTYIRDRQEFDTALSRGSVGTPKKEKVHRVLPMMGGQSIQPVVALDRTLNSSIFRNARSPTTSPDLNRSGSHRPVPMHMLLDVYIPLTRIDAQDRQTSNSDSENEDDAPPEMSMESLDLNGEDDDDSPDDAVQQMSDDEQMASRSLNTVEEVSENDNESSSNEDDNPLEGPSWLLDRPTLSSTSTQRNRSVLEPDSTTEMQETQNLPTPSSSQRSNNDKEKEMSMRVRMSCEFSPTVRRRKRSSSPPSPCPTHFSPRPASSRRFSNNGRVLKVLVAKMRLDESESAAGDGTPPKVSRGCSPRLPLRFDAPSPNGATDAGVIVLETKLKVENRSSGDIADMPSRSVPLRESRDSRDSHRTLLQDRRTSNDRTASSDQTTTQDRTISHERATTQDRSISQEWAISHDRATTPDRAVNRNRADNHDQTGHDRDTNHDRATSHSRATTNVRSISNSRRISHDSHNDSDSGSGDASDRISERRPRRPRKAVTYKEKPLNRKMRR